MAFRNYLNNTMLADELLESVQESELETLNEELLLIEGELNEIFGLGKLAAKIKKASDKGDEKAEELKGKAKEAIASAKEKGKEVLDTAKHAGKMFAKDVVDAEHGPVKTGKAILKTGEEMGKAAKEKAVELFTKSQSVFKDIWGKMSTENLTADQKATVEELKGIFGKLAAGKFLSGVDSIKVLAAVLAGSPEAGKIPSIKAYNKQLERLRTTPGMSSFKFTVKINK